MKKQSVICQWWLRGKAGGQFYFKKESNRAKLSNPMFKRSITDLKVIYLQRRIFKAREGEESQQLWHDYVLKIRGFLAINDKSPTNQKNAGCDF